ncbi:MAG: aminoglycoside phosphotransferase family protein [Anaerolineae bacterium]|nr:aminoglycoside phosphotransferase family protein [Anaerolineae bacterium]
MLEPPDIQEANIVACMQDEYGLSINQVTFLSLGADVHTAVYRVDTNDGAPYFLKLRSGAFDPASVALPKFLSDQGIAQIIPPIATKTRQLWGELGTYKTILYPFVTGKNAYEVVLSDPHWEALGTALKKIHTAKIPVTLMNSIRRETYSEKGRETVKMFLNRIEGDTFDDPIAVDMTVILRSKRMEILNLIGRVEYLAQKLQTQSLELVVCHSDLHAGNILIETDGTLYIVDWDEPILAPKERDLMYMGGGLLASGLKPDEEETLFYPAYGPTNVNATALAYYRYERIIQDIAAYCEELLLTKEGGEDRAQSLHYLKSNFLPNHTIDIAYRSDRTVWGEISSGINLL